MKELQNIIEQAWDNRELLKEVEAQNGVRKEIVDKKTSPNDALRKYNVAV